MKTTKHTPLPIRADYFKRQWRGSFNTSLYIKYLFAKNEQKEK